MKDGVPAEEVERAKRLMAGRLMLRMEDSRAVAAWMGAQESLVGRMFDVRHIIERIEAVTAEQVTETAARLLTPENLNMAIVGPLRGRKRLEKGDGERALVTLTNYSRSTIH